MTQFEILRGLARDRRLAVRRLRALSLVAKGAQLQLESPGRLPRGFQLDSPNPTEVGMNCPGDRATEAWIASHNPRHDGGVEWFD